MSSRDTIAHTADGSAIVGARETVREALLCDPAEVRRRVRESVEAQMRAAAESPADARDAVVYVTDWLGWGG